MGSKWVLVLFMFVSLEGCLSQISGCWDEERVALLQLKHFFSLQDWVEGDQHNNSDCCQWGRVVCNGSTGRVIRLFLDDTRDRELGEGYLNASLFSAFEQLEDLDLSFNSIAGFVDNGGLDKLSRLRNLESLDLEDNMFNNDIFSSLNALPSLTSLDLSFNRLNETVDLQGLYSCRNLTELYLNDNQIEKVVFPKGLDKLSRLRNLEYLDLSFNMFNNDIFSSINALPSLKSLYLWVNRLNETVDLQGLDSNKNLTKLDLSNNQIEKVVFPKGLDSCKNLKDLDLSYNQIEKVVIPKGSDKLLRLSNLENLDLSYNRFNNNIFSSLGALSSLKELYLNDNGLKGVVNVSGLDSLYNLESLHMGNNEIGKLIFPKGLRGLKYLYLENVGIHDASSLVSIPSLATLDLSYNNFSEMTTTQEYLHNFTFIEQLRLDGSSLHISLIQSFVVLTSPRELWMQNCQVNGVLGSQEYLNNFTNVELLNLDGSSLHISLLQFIGAFTSLNTLSMRSCQLNGILDFQGPDWLSRLSNLEFLDLQNNMFNNSILSSLGALSSLKGLYLSDNKLKGIVDFPDSLNNLEALDMSNNEIDKFIFGKGLKKLETLYLLNVSIHDEISSLLHSLASLPSLKSLDLSSNNFSDSTTTQDLPNFKNLTSLYMDHTSLDSGFLQMIELMTSIETISLVNCGLQSTLSPEDGAVIPKFFYHQQYLRFLDLSNNNLIGGFPNLLLENNAGLYDLRLANNLLGGYLSIHSHTSLTSLDISNNSFQGHIPKEVGDLPYLVTLNLSRNHFDGSIPSSIGVLNLLYSLDLSYNNLSGEIPEHLAEGCTALTVLVLSNNKLRGKIFSTKFNMTTLKTLQLNGNSFTGSIPDSLSKASLLEGLYLSENKISGRIPSWLGNMSSLEVIFMAHNLLEGPIPLEFCQFQSLEVLNLAENNLSGNLPSCSSPLSIKHVHLSKNKLQGQLEEVFFNSSSLVTLDLGYNRFDGRIPTWIGRLSKLTYLILSNNNLEGDVPTQLCQLNQLRMVDLSHNNLSGYIPSCLDFTALHSSDLASPFCSEILHNCSSVGIDYKEYQMNRIEESVEFTTKTNLYSYQGKVLTYMSGVDISCNKLTGPIPPQVGNLTRIHTLNLSHNNLTGPIPLTFSKLEQIESLDLSYNNLNGKIPPQLVDLYTLSSFTVAHNNLSGKTPERVAQFNTFGENSYEGNPLLCGPPLNKSCETTRQPSPMPGASTDKEEDNDLIDMDIFYMSFTGSYIIVFLGIAAVLYINPYWRRTWFYLAETWMTSCYYFIVDNLPHRFCH